MATTSRGFRTGMSPTSGDLEGLRADELGLELGLAVLQEHGDHLFEVLPQFVHRRTLGMRSRPARHVPEVQAGVGILLDDSGEVPHAEKASIVEVRRRTRASPLDPWWGTEAGHPGV